MKKILASLIAVCAIFLVVGCSNAKQDALVKYINEDMKSISTSATELINSYSTLISGDLTDAKAVISKLKSEVLVKSNELITKVEAITSKDSKVTELHAIYVKALKKQHEAFTTIVTGFETNDVDKINSATAIINEAGTLTKEYTAKLEELKTEYDVVTK